MNNTVVHQNQQSLFASIGIFNYIIKIMKRYAATEVAGWWRLYWWPFEHNENNEGRLHTWNEKKNKKQYIIRKMILDSSILF